MGKLADYLQKLKENKETDSSPFKGSNQKNPLPKFALGFLVSFFILSIMVGYYLPKFFQKKKEFFQEKRIASEQVMKAPSNMTASIANKTETKESQSKSIPFGNQTKEEERPKNLEVTKKTIEKKNKLGKRDKKEKPPKPKETTPALTISPQGEPPLRNKELASNLLLNAEEERKRGNYDEAIRLYHEYLKFKEDPNVLNNLGALYLLKGDYKRAETLFERALRIKKDPFYEINYYIALLKQGKLEAVCQEVKNKEYPTYLRDYIEFIKGLCR